MLLDVAIEGGDRLGQFDWCQISQTLAQRGLSHQALENVYAQLQADIRVSTRGLTLAKCEQQAAVNKC